MVIVAILNAGRNSFSFFLLLIVCLGYGVVKPSLGKTMITVRILAIMHFIFGVIYAIGSLSITPESAGMPFVTPLNFLTSGLTDRYRTISPSRHPSLVWNSDSVLCVDIERPATHDQRPFGSETDGEGGNVYQTPMVSCRQHSRHLRIPLV